MYARSSTFEARPESIDAGVAYIRDDVMPMLADMEGCVGLSMIVDRRSGRCIATSAWESEEARRASAERLRPVRDRAGEILGGSARVEEWDIAYLHRDHRSAAGAAVRVTWTQCAPEDLEAAIGVYKMSLLPAMEQLEGFCSASLMVSRESGRAVSSLTYDSTDAMDQTRDQADALRETGARDAGVEVIDVCEFDLALAHLRVPELV